MSENQFHYQYTAWCSEIGSLNAPELHASVTSETNFTAPGCMLHVGKHQENKGAPLWALAGP